jgi:radical SAM protein with 4Fe4S-binding SPASM domain
MGFYYSLNKLKRRLFLRNFFLLYQNHRVPPPGFVVWDSTKSCNLKCIHCGSQGNGRDELDSKEVMIILDQLAAAGVGRFQITGGEPLLRKDLFQILHYAAKRFSVSLTSNGYYLDEEKAGLLAEAGVSSVQISIDGPDEVHDTIRGDPQSYTMAIDAVKALKSYPQITVGVSTTVMPHNLESLTRLQEILVPLKVAFWSLGIVMPTGKARNDCSLWLTQAQFGFLLDFIEKARREISIEFNENFPYLGESDRRIRRSPKLCPAGILSCCIGVDGRLRGCSDQDDSNLYWEGDLRQDSFSDIWQRGFRRYRTPEMLNNDQRCRQCADSEDCRGGCWVMREQNLHCYLDYLR